MDVARLPAAELRRLIDGRQLSCVELLEACLVGLALFVWATRAAGGIGAILEQSDRLAAAREDSSRLAFTTTLFIPWLTAMVGF